MNICFFTQTIIKFKKKIQNFMIENYDDVVVYLNKQCWNKKDIYMASVSGRREDGGTGWFDTCTLDGCLEYIKKIIVKQIYHVKNSDMIFYYIFCVLVSFFSLQ